MALRILLGEGNASGKEMDVLNRKVSLIEAVREKPGITSSALAERFGVSERTIRTYVRQINEELAESARLEHRRGDGYELVVEDSEKFESAVQRASLLPDLPSTPEERVSYLLDDLLHRNEWITLDELASIMCVSRATLSADLKVVEKKISSFGLSIERRPRYGLRVAGPEVSRRLCLASLVVDGPNADGAAGGLIARVASCVQDAINKADFHVNSAAYHNLIVHIAIAIRRMKAGAYVPMSANDVNDLKASPAYLAAEEITGSLAETFDVEFPVEEVAYIALHLAGRRVIDESSAGDDKGLVISDEVWFVVDEMIEIVRDTFGFDFRSDLELRMNLARHVEPLSIRLRHHMRIENPLLQDIQERFPLGYSMAQEAAAVLADKYGEQPSEEEIGYIAFSFILAMERQSSSPAKKNIVIVCTSGQGSAKLLEHQYRREFGAWLGSIRTCDVARVSSMDFRHVDYVFTTVPLGISLPVPVREVHFFLDEDDVRNVREFLSSTEREGSASSYFDERLFFTHLSFSSKREVLDYLCEQVCRIRPIHGDLRGLVEQREAMAETSFGNQVAMPHPIEPCSDETFVACALLDDPIEWNSHEVRAVFLVCISKSEEKLDTFYESFTALLSSSVAIQELVDSQQWKTLIKLLDR